MKFNWRTNAITPARPINFAHRKPPTASVYLATALLLPPAANCIQLRLLSPFCPAPLFFARFNIRYFVVLRETGTIARTIAIGRGVSHKKWYA